MHISSAFSDPSEYPVLKFSLPRILIRGDEMGYRIEYHTAQRKQGNFLRFVRLPLLTIVCFVIFLFLVGTLWPEGAAWIEKSGFFAKSMAAVAALDELADGLHYGEPLVTAFAEFYGKLMP